MRNALLWVKIWPKKHRYVTNKLAEYAGFIVGKIACTVLLAGFIFMVLALIKLLYLIGGVE